MARKDYSKQNYVFLYRGMLIARDALLDFIVNSLEEFHGREWWKLGVEPAFRAEDMEKLKQQFEKRFSSPDGPARPGTELYEMLDLNYFGNIIEFNWKKVFSARLNNDRTLLEYVKEVVKYRNPVAHSESGDLRDDDTFRGLDTSDRMLRLIDQNAADEIARIKNELRRAWIYGEIGLGNFTPDKVGINIEKGFADLEQAMQGQPGAADDLRRLQDLRETLLNDISLIRESAAGKPSAVIDSLQELSQIYLGVDFATACLAPAFAHKYTPEDVRKRTLRLDQMIEAVTKQIEHQKRALELQKTMGFEQRKLELSSIDSRQKLVQGLQNDLARVREELTAPVFFAVNRTAEPAVQEEKSFTVQVELKNLGRQKTRVRYQEGLPPDIALLDGAIEHEVEVEPDAPFVFSYTCLCERTGSHSFHTRQLDYPEKTGGWDVLRDTVVIGLPGKGPHLEGRRYYQYQREGIELVVRLENIGDKRAQGLRIDQTVSTRDNATYETKYEADVPAKGKTSAACLVPVADVSEIVLPEKTTVTYFDNNGKEYTLDLTGPFSLLEYDFPELPHVLGRRSETETVEKILKVVSGLAAEGQLYMERRLILVEGIAGVGKTRFVREIQRAAEHSYSFQVRLADVSNRSPVKRILRSLLGLDPGFASGEMAWERLEKYSLDEDMFTRYRGALARFVSSDYDRLDEAEMQDLTTAMVLLLRELCRRDSYLLVFENAHDFPEGMELTLFQKLLQYAAETSDSRLAVCVTYRPGNALPEQFLGGVRSGRYERVGLAPLSRPETVALVDEWVPYPLLCEELQEFVFEWSTGNPFYVRELLRHLVLSEQGFVQRIGDKWYPSETFDRDGFTSKEENLSSVLLQRVKEDTGGSFPAVQVMAVVGLELPYRLLSPLFASSKFFPLTEKQLLETLDLFVRKGIVKQSNTDSLQELEYRFEHQLLRDAVYNALRDTAQHTLIRDQVVAIVVENTYQESAARSIEIYADRAEHYRQVARHLLYSGAAVQFIHREFLLRAAHVEEAAHNFERALDYYRSFLKCSGGRDNYVEQAEAYVGSAEVLKLQGNYRLAIEQLKNASDVLGRESRREQKELAQPLASRILAELGFLYMKTGDVRQANDHLSKARLRYEGFWSRLRLGALPRDKDYIEDLFQIYLALAEIWYRKLDTTGTIDLRAPLTDLHWNLSDGYFARAETIAKTYFKYFGDNRLVIDVLVREGEIRSRSQRDLALKKLLSAVESIKKQTNGDSSASYALERAYSHLAEIYRERAEPEAAREYYMEALEVQKKLGDTYGLAISNGGIGDLYMQQGRYQDAEYYLLEAHRRQSDVHDVDRLWRTGFSLTKVYLNSGSLEKARKYWNGARTLVLDRVPDLPDKKVNDIFETLLALAKSYFSAGNLEYALPLCLDLQMIGVDGRRFEVDQMLGRIYHKMKEPDKAIRALYEGLDSTQDPLQRADIHSLIGDISASTEGDRFRRQAEESYEESVRLFVQSKLEKEALDRYDRLLRYISGHEDTSRLSPLLHSLIELMFQNKRGLSVKFLEKAERLYNHYELQREAGDTFVHLAHKAVQLKDPERQTRLVYGDEGPLFADELTLLKKAESHYARCKVTDDAVSGYLNLISVYFRMDLWEEIARCYREILRRRMDSPEDAVLLRNLNEIQHIYKQPGVEEMVLLVKKHQTLLDTLREINMLDEKFGMQDTREMAAEVEKIEAKALAQPDEFTADFMYALMLQNAKLLHHLSEKIKENKGKQPVLEKALDKYNRIIAEASDPGTRGVAFNDSALILQSKNCAEEAEVRLQEAILLARSTTDEFSEACCRANLARLLSRQGRFPEAAAHYEQSIGYLMGRSNFWDERWKNQDKTPLTSAEIAQLWFDKKWCANVAAEYGPFLFSSDYERGRSLLGYAETIFLALRQPDRAEDIRKMRELMEQMRQRSIPALGGGLESMYLPGSLNPVASFNQQSYVTCASCGFVHNAGRKGCPRCGEVTCPHCGQITDPAGETCELCDGWLG